MTSTMTRLALVSLFGVSLASGVDARAQDVAAEQPTEVTIGESGSAQDPLSGRDVGLAIEPEEVKDPERRLQKRAVPAIRLKVDPRVLGVAPGEPLPALRREGEAIRQRDGRLIPTDRRGYAVFILDADPEAGDGKPLAMIVAPCLTLESMERMVERRGDNLRFTITGVVHTYRGVNYLLPTAQPKPWLIDADGGSRLVSEPKQDAESTPASDPDPSQTGDADGGAALGDAAGQVGDKATPSADDVLEQLLEQRRDRPTALPDGDATEGSGATASGSPGAGPRLANDPLLLGLDTGQPMAELKDEGQFIVARTGRMIRSADGSQALFVLDADGPGAPEPPMILQACKLLETMEQTVQQQGEDVPFVVTGQVYVYRGANYLLPSIVKREFDPGNLE